VYQANLDCTASRPHIQLVFAWRLRGSHRQSVHVLTQTNDMPPGLSPCGLSLRLAP